jgi:class 3 adenylate cyclase
MTFMCGAAMPAPRLLPRSRFVRAAVARLRSQTTIDRIASWVEEEQPDLRRASAPDGTVTMLFSDIENSTRLNERLGDQHWLEMLGTHNSIVRAQADEHRGYEVKAQGDGFMIAFPSARQAVGCAIDVQRALARRAANGELPVRVRIGIHTGEAIQQGGDFYGASVATAARIADHAEWARPGKASASRGSPRELSRLRVFALTRVWAGEARGGRAGQTRAVADGRGIAAAPINAAGERSGCKAAATASRRGRFHAPRRRRSSRR